MPSTTPSLWPAAGTTPKPIPFTPSPLCWLYPRLPSGRPARAHGVVPTRPASSSRRSSLASACPLTAFPAPRTWTSLPCPTPSWPQSSVHRQTRGGARKASTYIRFSVRRRQHLQLSRWNSSTYSSQFSTTRSSVGSLARQVSGATT